MNARLPMKPAALLFALLVSTTACEIREEPDLALARADSILRASAEKGAAELTVEAGGVAAAHGDTVAIGGGAGAAERSARLSPLADTIATRLVFMTYGQRALVAAGRAERLLLDLGRVDHRVETAAQRTAYLEAVRALSPVQTGDRFRVSGAWGSEEMRVVRHDVWNGRIVAVLQGSARADSVVRGRAPVVAIATRADSTVEETVRTCRSTGSPAMTSRVRVVTDSLLHVLRADTAALTASQRRNARASSTHAIGCFAGPSAVVFASLVVGDHDQVRQEAVLVEPSGDVVRLAVVDRRFKAHELLHALDTDGDGVDDLAVRGRARRVGGTVVMRLDPAKRALEWVAEGFAWETM